MTEREKEYWRVIASLQELIRVSDDDVDKNSDLKLLLHSVANVAMMYREHGPEAILESNRIKELRKLGIPVITPKRK